MDEVRKNEIVAVLLFAAGLFLFLSIFTFNAQDLSFFTTTPNVIPQNATGVIGSYLGGILLFFIGKAAYVIPLLIFVWGIARLFQIKTRKFSSKFFGTAVLVVTVSASLSMMGEATAGAAFSQGGIVGAVVSDFLFEYLGRVGAGVFVAAMIVLSVLVATEFLVLPVLLSVLKFIAGIPAHIRKFLSRSLRSSSLDGNAPLSQKAGTRASRAEVAGKLAIMKAKVDEVRKTAFAVQSGKKSFFGKPNAKNGAEPKIIASGKSQKFPTRPARIAGVADSSTGEKIEYKMPSLDLLRMPSADRVKERDETLKKKAAILGKTLAGFGVEASVVKINKGPVITMYELEPAMGTKVNQITSLSDNISLAMKSANIRVVAPLPGKGTVGIEVPNEESELVLLRDILETSEYSESDSPLKFALGKDITGAPIVTDLGKMPHLLIAGATGSGKTVCLNCIITSFLYNASPDELKFLMIDPKRVELMMFEGIPHLISPIVTNPKKAAASLNWVVKEMERRYEIFSAKGVRNLGLYNDKKSAAEENLPYIIVVVDELADLMMIAQQDVEGAIMRIAQLARAAGIHLILATQRPSVNVVTGVIKANFPARISFKVASKVDSRTVLDANGAEKLLGRGDMLFMEPGESSLIRGQCSLVEDSEIRNIVKFVRSQAGPQYIEQVIEGQERKVSDFSREKDTLYKEAVEMVFQTKQASVSMIQRKFRVGYTRAARMIDIMEEEGIVGAYNGSKPREILIADLKVIEE
ncbi:MAG: DNA translocase FtsK [Candidatus Omnitrophota bacterium]